jgi:3-deoxy-D-manno-octulosonate 8-phosphate phosphatase (KDO 8-P phosphatase)
MQTEACSLADRCRTIELLVLDVDGVLTVGEIVYDNHGDELKLFHVRDGSGLKCWRQAGKQTAVISGRKVRSVSWRARELGIDIVLQGVQDKLGTYNEVISKAQLSPSQVCALGDDLADLPLLRQSGLGIAVADACPELLGIAHYVTGAAGGKGAVREAIELVLRCQGRWEF